MRRSLIFSFYLISRISGQVIESGQMPFGGLASVYEADTSAAAFDITPLTAPGTAQAWTFTESLPRPVADTLTVSENDPFNRTVKQISIVSRFRHGIMRDTPEAVFYRIEPDGMIEFGTGQEEGDILHYPVPLLALPLPLDVGAQWIYEMHPEIPMWMASDPVAGYVQRNRITADAAGSLLLGDKAYYTIRLQISVSEIISYDDGQTVTIERLAYRWIAPYLGPVLEIWSLPGETDVHFSEAGQIRRLKSSNAEDFGCDPTCDPDYYRTPGFQLYQNAPNPFNSTTNIRYAIDFPSSVELSIFNSRGETVFSEHRISIPGITNFRWTGQDPSGRPQPGGIYFYSLRVIPVDKKTQTHAIKRMILIR